MPQTVEQYRKAFRPKQNESPSAAKDRMESRIAILLREGKLVNEKKNVSTTKRIKRKEVAKNAKG
jgi:hypothetical protein